MSSIAIIGTSGILGGPVLKELSNSKYADKIKYPIKAITSKDKSAESTEKVTFIQGNLQDAELAARLGQIDVVISLVSASKEVLENTETLLARLKPKLFIPPEYGTESDKVEKELRVPMIDLKLDHVSRVRNQLGIKCVSFYIGFIKVPPFLYDFLDHAGVSLANKTVLYLKHGGERSNGNVLIPFTTATDLAKAISTVVVSDPSKILDSYRIYSNSILVKDIAQLKAAELGGAKFTPIYKTLDELTLEFKSLVAAGNPDFIKFLTVSVYRGPGHGISFEKDEREIINPSQSLWTWESW